MSDDNVTAMPWVALDGEVVSDDVAALARAFPGYEFGSAFVTAASGPDYRYLWARRDGVLIAAPSRSQLARELNARERQEIEPPDG